MDRSNRRARRHKPAACVTILAEILIALLVNGGTPVAASAQKPSTIRHDEGESTRPRRVVEGEKDYGEDGPIIRIGLMNDVTSISLGSTSGLIVRRTETDRTKKLASSQVRVELRRQTDSGEVSKSTKSNSKPVIRKSQSRYTEPIERPTSKFSYKPNFQVAAFEADKMIAFSDEMLIVAPADGDAGTRGRGDAGSLPNDGDPVTSTPDFPIAASPRRPISVSQPKAVRVGSKEYRGEIHLLVNQRGRLNVINALPLEQYLRGVVPLELSPGAFPELEALKAQAIAARTYALSHRGQYSSEGFDLHDTAQSQVYGGLSAEHPLTNRAVEETRGMAALYQATPIEALYTSTCGGRTENNELVFLGKPLPYLRSVECSPDKAVISKREITSNRAIEPVIASEGRGVVRSAAFLEVLGFSLPRRWSSQYLRASAGQDELLSWIERAALLAQRIRPSVPRYDITHLPAFVHAVATAIYGAGRASLLLSEADIDYILAGLGGEDLPREMRADMAMLLKDGVVSLPAEGRVNESAQVTRAFAIDTLARALFTRSQISSLKFEKALVQSVMNGRLSISRRSGRDGPPNEFEIEANAWLLRRLGGESFLVSRLILIGGERVTYHLNAKGRVDFIEAELTGAGASSDRFSRTAAWQERIGVDELKRRLARARIDVGQIENLSPVSYGLSNRVVEMEIVGSEGRARLRGHQIRNALGLKEILFVVDAERDEQGRATAFLFTGRGWGHGVGMCQTGAYGLAKEGYSYKHILQKYYTGIRVQKLY